MDLFYINAISSLALDDSARVSSNVRKGRYLIYCQRPVSMIDLMIFGV